MHKHRVEMRPAYEWTCEECGRNHFESCIVAEWDEGERLEQAKSMGLVEEFATSIPVDFQGDFVTYPDAVTCPDCGSEFATKHMTDE